MSDNFRAQKLNVSKEQHTDKKQPLLTFSFSFAASLATVGEQPESGELIMRFPAFGAKRKKKRAEKKFDLCELIMRFPTFVHHPPFGVTSDSFRPRKAKCRNII